MNLPSDRKATEFARVICCGEFARLTANVAFYTCSRCGRRWALTEHVRVTLPWARIAIRYWKDVHGQREN